MIVDIEKIIVKDRIRKDFGDIKELADDIKQNGLINPPVVNKEYELLAGERRLRACKLLGWSQIEVRMMDTRNEEHDFDVEVSENENRKDFSRTEREAIYTRRVERRMKNNGGKFTPKFKEVQEEVAKEMGTSRTNMQHESEILRNKNLLDPSDFAEWDEGKLSTNKVFQKVKEKQKEIEAENNKLRSALSESEARRIQAEQNVKEVVKEIEIIPDDYVEYKKKAKLASSYENDYKREHEKVNEEKRRNLELQNKIDELKLQTAQATTSAKLIEGSIYFVAQCGSFVRDMGGYIWIADKIAELPDGERVNFIKAVKAIHDWAEILQQNIERNM